MTELFALEREIMAEGYPVLCGVDEAGRGPLAGPVCAAAVILPPDLILPGLDDSKKLTERRREALYGEICAGALGYGVGWASHEEIDELNILGATYLAMNRAVEALNMPFDLALIDGNRSEGITSPNRTVVGGDGLCRSIAAASILAKVSRDRLMLELDRRYPRYGFARHKGYPTRAHYAALDESGPSPVHRQSFLKKWREGKRDAG